MRVVCVDDEPLILHLTMSLCQELSQVDEVEGFAGSREALDWFAANSADLALLDVDMPEINGIELAKRIRSLHPDAKILFVTGYSDYAVAAFQMHASGYLLKPLSKEKLVEEVDYLFADSRTGSSPKITVQTFGNFDVFVGGKLVSFPRAKSKEVLAYLVDRRGSSVTRAELSSILWEDSFYDRNMQKQLDVIIRGLRSALQNAGIEEMLEIQSGAIRAVPETFDCDLYRFLDGDENTVKEYRGEYMSAYSWASMTEAYLEEHRPF